MEPPESIQNSRSPLPVDLERWCPITDPAGVIEESGEELHRRCSPDNSGQARGSGARQPPAEEKMPDRSAYFGAASDRLSG
jgi:hypothetical protein